MSGNRFADLSATLLEAYGPNIDQSADFGERMTLAGSAALGTLASLDRMHHSDDATRIAYAESVVWDRVEQLRELLDYAAAKPAAAHQSGGSSSGGGSHWL
jgi:hypothetical protein